MLMEDFFVVSLSSCRQISYGTANYAVTVSFHTLSSSSFTVSPITGHKYYVKYTLKRKSYPCTSH
jgi:hypothetical protein